MSVESDGHDDWMVGDIATLRPKWRDGTSTTTIDISQPSLTIFSYILTSGACGLG